MITGDVTATGYDLIPTISRAIAEAHAKLAGETFITGVVAHAEKEVPRDGPAKVVYRVIVNFSDEGAWWGLKIVPS